MILTCAIVIDSIRSAVPSLILFGTAIPYMMVEVVLVTATAILPQRIYVKIDDFMWGCYQRLVLFFFEQISGIKLVLYGDTREIFRSKENVLYISNHQSDVDWAIADMLAIRQGSLGHLRYILKKELRWIPLYGWYFYQHGCVYVRRGKGTFRSDITTRQLNYMARSNFPFWLVVFPEGTRVSTKKTKTFERSQEFAVEKGYKPFRHHLFPRVRGLQLATEYLRERLDAVYDVTAVYSHTRPDHGTRIDAPNMFGFVASPPKSELHILVRRIPISEVPKSENDLENWLYGRFEQKDSYLSHYYSNSYKPGDPVFPDLQEPNSVLPWRRTLPATFVLCSALFGCLATELGRRLTWQTALFGTVGGYLVMTLKEGA